MKNVVLALLAFACTSMNLSAQDLTVDELIDKGGKFHDKGEYVSALTYYRQALSADSNSTRALYEMANTYVNMAKYPDAYDYASRVIAKNKDYVDQAYTLKGTSLDLMEKPYEALEAYLEGIKAFPDNYLLRYNAALVYFNRKQYADAEFQATKAVESRPTHPSSHLILAYSAYYQHKRIPAILSLYYFLMLENDTKRAGEAFQIMTQEISDGVTKKDDNHINIAVSGGGIESEFGAAELMLAMSQALKFDSKSKDKTQTALFAEQTGSFFSILGEQGEKKKRKGVWWNMYIPFFQKLNKKSYTETMCYYISVTSQQKDVLDWLDANKDKVEKMFTWCDEELNKKK